ncbi:MAG: hypothetical protein AB7S93_14415 [Xanthobacteraceae bacterium]
MRYPPPVIVRIGPRPDPPEDGLAAIVGPRPRGSRRPHTDAKVAAVRRLIEQTTLTYSEVAAKTGVGRASICRWTRDGQWQRPLFAPRATDTVPSARAGARLKLRTLFARLSALAERSIRELEASPSVDPDKLAEALELLKMAKLTARPRSRRRPAEAAGAEPQAWDAGPRAVVRSLRAAGIDTQRAPEEAVMDFIESRAPPPPKRRQRGRRFTRAEYHAWMMEKVR